MCVQVCVAAAAHTFVSPSAESQDSGYLYFCFRWLLIRFKRELSFQDVLRLWEVGVLVQAHDLSSSGLWWGGGQHLLVEGSLPSSGPQVMWTHLPCHNFHLLVCCAILDSEKQKIMEENFGFNEILKVSVATPTKLIHAAPWSHVWLPPALCCSTSTSSQ